MMISIERIKASAEPPCGRGSEKRGDSSRLPRAHAMRPQSARAALALVSLALLAPSYAAAADNEDVAELKRVVEELQAHNRELSRRLGALESAREAPAAPRTKPAGAQERPTPAPTPAEPPTTGASPPRPPPLPGPRDTTELELEQRVEELEIAGTAQESATRQIIQDTIVTTGPKINSF